MKNVDVSELEGLVIRTSDKDRKARGGFQWPERGVVECPDWNDKPECGGGFHGLLWGEGDWSLLSSAHDATWQVVKIALSDSIKIDGQKIKFKKGEIVHSGGMAEAFELVLCHKTRFALLQKEAGKKSSGGSSTAASSGDSSTAASSGDFSTAASSGDFSKAASSGDSSTAASSGYFSTAASSGDFSKAASSGDSSTAASSGYSSKAASSGNSSEAASSGNSSKAASSGYSRTAAPSGNSSTAASSGYSSTAASSGYSSKAASSGYSSKAASSGDFSTAASSGDFSKAASSGDFSTAASSGNNTLAFAAGNDSQVKAGKGGAIATAWWDSKKERFHAVAGDIGITKDSKGKILKPDTFYKLKAKGKWEIAK